MKSTLPYLAATVIVVASGVVQGLRTDRWTMSHELRDAVARIDRLPMSFGNWVGRPADLDLRQLEAAGIAGGTMRTYQNTRDGRTLNVLLVCGRPGPIAVHTPDICYAGAGYALQESPALTPVAYGAPAHTAETFRGDFIKQNSIVEKGLRIFWTWSPGGGWQAPDNPRLTFARHRALYKLYVVRETSVPVATTGEDVGASFLKDFLPELDRVLTPPAA